MADVLIVDEDPRIRTMLGWYLAVQGHEVRGAGSAAEALDAVAAQEPEVLILDTQLAGTDGHDLLSLLHAQCLAPEATVVVLTGCKSTDLMVRSWELGVSVHVTKPVDPEVVAEAVARHLAPRSLALTS